MSLHSSADRALAIRPTTAVAVRPRREVAVRAPAVPVFRLGPVSQVLLVTTLFAAPFTGLILAMSN